MRHALARAGIPNTKSFAIYNGYDPTKEEEFIKIVTTSELANGKLSENKIAEKINQDFQDPVTFADNFAVAIFAIENELKKGTKLGTSSIRQQMLNLYKILHSWGSMYAWAQVDASMSPDEKRAVREAHRDRIDQYAYLTTGISPLLIQKLFNIHNKVEDSATQNAVLELIGLIIKKTPDFNDPSHLKAVSNIEPFGTMFYDMKRDAMYNDPEVWAKYFKSDDPRVRAYLIYWVGRDRVRRNRGDKSHWYTIRGANDREITGLFKMLKEWYESTGADYTGDLLEDFVLSEYFLIKRDYQTMKSISSSNSTLNARLAGFGLDAIGRRGEYDIVKTYLKSHYNNNIDQYKIDYDTGLVSTNEKVKEIMKDVYDNGW